MSSSLPLQIAETIQTASLNRHPSPAHDINPSTAASAKQPVRVSVPTSPRSPSPSHARSPHSLHLRPLPRRSPLPPLPDLRFEQSYLASIAAATSWAGVAYITARDQVLLPLVQGTLWTLGVCGWRAWNRGAAVGGGTVGGRLRRWWWGVNNWSLPEEGGKMRGARGMGDVGLAGEVQDFYQGQASAGGD